MLNTRSIISAPRMNKRVVFCRSTNRPENISVFGLCNVPSPTTIDEIEEYLIMTSKEKKETKQEIFTGINVDYDQVRKNYYNVVKLERIYNNSKGFLDPFRAIRKGFI